MTKDEIKEKLDKLGIEYDSDAKKDELEALLPEEKTDEDETPKKEKRAQVYDGSGHSVRIYTKEQSDPKDTEDGKDFIEKAECYAEKIGGTSKVI